MLSESQKRFDRKSSALYGLAGWPENRTKLEQNTVQRKGPFGALFFSLALGQHMPMKLSEVLKMNVTPHLRFARSIDFILGICVGMMVGLFVANYIDASIESQYRNSPNKPVGYVCHGKMACSPDGHALRCQCSPR
jgi:hypothetical protein